ncbi:hypothetical protein SAMN04488094_1177 [Tropicimonas isoalkanivorans]|uniref:Uncharacterized protein n=2 Tax=Tropicimonas isoalkanivorans TaxID=441112 RepID=A0A1I1PX84_9RHOB|nr:hypothetical protein SAMN04488094_1177 [Tropicimonas isoalkanivorans]
MVYARILAILPALILPCELRAACVRPEEPLWITPTGEEDTDFLIRQSFQVYWSEMGQYLTCLNDEAAAARDAINYSLEFYNRVFGVNPTGSWIEEPSNGD